MKHTIKEQLISFTTAKLAKEKGFNVLDGRKYDKYFYRKYKTDSEDCVVWSNMTGRDLYDLWYASTQSLLQTWLREIHNINICVHHHCEGVTYEEELEIRLQESLKLIN